MQGRRSAACRFASTCEISEVKSSPHALAVHVWQTWLRALRSASACETLDSKVRDPLPHRLLAVYVSGGSGSAGGGVVTRGVTRGVPGQLHAAARASAAACETLDVKLRVRLPQVLYAV